MVRERKEQEFMDSKQGGRSVAQYLALFHRLRKYAPHITRDEKRKSRKFISGLRQDLRPGHAGHRYESPFAMIWLVY